MGVEKEGGIEEIIGRNNGCKLPKFGKYINLQIQKARQTSPE